MARISGTYQPPAGQPVVNGDIIDATVHNNLITDIGNEITNSIPRDGTAPPTANLPLGGYKITGLANGTASSDAAAFGQIATAITANNANYLPLAGGSLTGLLNVNDGADIASATTVDLAGATGNTVRITGTTAITAFTMNAGQQMELIAVGALPLTYNATTMNINGGASYTCAAGDRLSVFKDGAGVIQVNVTKQDGTSIASSRRLAQIVTFQTGAVATGTTIIPHDNTIPQITEGDQYMSLAITPTNASSTLEITVTAIFSTSANNYLTAALFQDSTANALAAVCPTPSIANYATTYTFTHIMTAGTTSATTFKLRAGGGVANTTTFNGEAGAQLMGGIMSSRITIKEYLP